MTEGQDGFTYEIKTECDEMAVVVSEPKTALAVATARENGLIGQCVEARLLGRIPSNALPQGLPLIVR